MKMTIGKRITLGFASVIIIAIALGAFAYTRLLAIKSHSDQITKESIPTLKLIYRVRKNALDSDRIVYKHIGSDDKADMALLETSIQAASTDNAQVYGDLGKLIVSEKGLSLMEQVKSTRTEYDQSREEVLTLSRQGTNNTAAYALARSRMDPASQKYVAALEASTDFIQTELDEASKNIQGAVQSSVIGILAGLIASTLVGMAISFIISRGTSRTLHKVSNSLNDGSNQVASASGQVSAASQTLAEGSSQQAASLEETSSSLEEMASMTKRNSENARKANELAKEARIAADKGVGEMQTMAAAMDAIKVSSPDIS